MKILKKEIEKLIKRSSYTKKKQFEDTNLNDFLNYWIFFEEYEPLIKELTNEPIEVILYSKYYWCSKYKNLYTKLYGKDVGLEQQQYKLVEELDQRLDEDIDWECLQLIENGDL